MIGCDLENTAFRKSGYLNLAVNSISPSPLFLACRTKKNDSCLLIEYFDIEKDGLADTEIAQAVLNRTADNIIEAAQRKEDEEPVE